MRRAIGRAMLMGLFGPDALGSTLRETVDEAYADISPSKLFGDYNWYTTLALERTMDLKERPGADVDFVLPERMLETGREAVRFAAPALDIVTSIVTTVVDPGVFDMLILDDRVHLFAEGKRPSGIPVFTGTASANVGRGGDAPQRLGWRIGLLKTIEPRQLSARDWLGRVAYWRVQSLQERDPWKKFQWSFLALEILTNKLFDDRRSNVLGQLRLVDAG